MKSVRFIIGLFVLAWLELFCSDPVSIEWQGDREVVVSCILTRDTVQTVNLSYSSSMQDGKVEFVDSAEVVISGIYVYNGYKSGPGEWTVPCQPLPGKEYQLEVRLPDGRVLLAETRFPEILALNSVELYQPESWLYEEEENWLLPVEDENERYLLTKDLPLFCRHFDEKLFNEFKRAEHATSFHHEMPGLLFRLEPNVVCYISAAFHEKGGELAPIRYLATNHLEVDNFNVTKLRYRFDDYASISGNALRDRYDRETFPRYDGLAMHDGFLRIVQTEGYDNSLKDVYQVSIPPFSGADQFLPIEAANQFFTVVGSYASTVFDKNVSPDDAYPMLFFSTVSEEYDRFLKYVYEKGIKIQEDLISSIYSDSRDLPGNIEGGYGIFGSIGVQTVPLHRLLNHYYKDPVYYAPPAL